MKVSKRFNTNRERGSKTNIAGYVQHYSCFLFPVRRTGYVCSILLFSLFGNAQITTSQFLASAKKDAIFQLKKDRALDIQKNPLRLPDWDDVEFRMENNRFEEGRNEYAIRLTRNPNALKKVHLQTHRSLLQIADIESVIEFSKALEDRYLTILQAKFSNALREKSESLIEVLKDKKRVVENRLVFGLSDNLENLAAIEEDLQDEELRLLEFNFFDRLLTKEISGEFTGLKSTILFDNFISPEKLDTLLTKIKNESIINNPGIRRRTMQADLAAREENIEQLENQQLINFLQLRYSEDPDPDELFREKLSVSMGLRLGQGKQSSIRAQERKIQKLEADKETQIEQIELEKEFVEVSNEIDFLLSKRNLLQKQLDEFAKNYSPEVFLQKGIAKPMTLLKLKETILKKEIDLIKTEYDLFESYIELLFLTGKPIEMPLRNYLDKRLAAF